jgi:adenosylcobyric acid synthase
VELEEDLDNPDAIILPGTKNTVDDLKELRAKGMDKKIISEGKKGTPIIGICGGYQILGKEIIDIGLEGTGGSVSLKGLGLLDASTRFCEYSKQTTQVEKEITGSGKILGELKGERVKGYEIHMGRTESKNHAFGDDGCVSDSGLIIGTYLHGLFENENIRISFLSYLYKQKGMIFEKIEEDDSIEELAGFIEAHVNMDMIYHIIEG